MTGSCQHITIHLVPPDAHPIQGQAATHVDPSAHDDPSKASPLHTQGLMESKSPRNPSPFPILTPVLSPQYLITMRSTYRSSSITLAQMAFFGASLSYANLFSHLTPHPVLLSWAASSFVVGAVGAGTMSFFGQFDNIWNGDGRNQNTAYVNTQTAMESTQDLIVGAYGWISCSLVLIGLALLNLSMVVPALKLDSGIYNSATFTNRGIVAAGLFAIAGLLALSLGAMYVRYRVDLPIMRASRKDETFHIQTQPTLDAVTASPETELK
ncbi:hypothetical protein CROQUDRAFT_130941 [Cronartium quercuum f. sp. fusiforme G11]|uniref:Uncharacterized protein n=1 Tax=Cronartium quercuum f. sp. fusiforme G11 TaxID=708437 RepID=A0A9P6NTE7_9BASI|nr:hypothetical protein CROQUDRAFT_130941 [Cronartium quercuum f. sp. fusiforme G11]